MKDLSSGVMHCLFDKYLLLKRTRTINLVYYQLISRYVLSIKCRHQIIWVVHTNLHAI